MYMNAEELGNYYSSLCNVVNTNILVTDYRLAVYCGVHTKDFKERHLIVFDSNQQHISHGALKKLSNPLSPCLSQFLKTEIRAIKWNTMETLPYISSY